MDSMNARTSTSSAQAETTAHAWAGVQAAETTPNGMQYIVAPVAVAYCDVTHTHIQWNSGSSGSDQSAVPENPRWTVEHSICLDHIASIHVTC